MKQRLVPELETPDHPIRPLRLSTSRQQVLVLSEMRPRSAILVMRHSGLCAEIATFGIHPGSVGTLLARPNRVQDFIQPLAWTLTGMTIRRYGLQVYEEIR
jgi:hypothetical protein